MKRLAVLLSTILDIAVFALFLAATGFLAYFGIKLIGMGMEIGGQDLDNGMDEVSSVIVNGIQGFITSVPIVFAVIFIVLAVVAIVFAIVNIQSAMSGFTYIKNGAFATHTQQNRMRAAMGVDFFAGVSLIVAYVMFKYYDELKGTAATAIIVCLIAGIAAILGAICKFAAVRQRIEPKNPPYNNGNFNNRW